MQVVQAASFTLTTMIKEERLQYFCATVASSCCNLFLSRRQANSSAQDLFLTYTLEKEDAVGLTLDLLQTLKIPLLPY
eukprot:1161067-Pelagomonas_calceolata.AAC.2